MKIGAGDMVSVKFKSKVVWLTILLLLALLTANRHRHTGHFNWRTELWADPAGYYVYLPALFIYDFDAERFPAGIDKMTGNGFELDRGNGRVITRYTYGVALLQAPFFAIVHTFKVLTSDSSDGFSGLYHRVPDMAAVFYAFAGIFFLWRFLRLYFSLKISLGVMLSVILGTNVIYYAIDATGMSHIYSFSLFAALLFLTRSKLIRNDPVPFSFLLLWGLLSALVVLIRPTNLFFLLFLVVLDIRKSSELMDRLKVFLNAKFIGSVIVAAIVVFTPQMLYWKYASGNFLTDPYEGYGFTRWLSPAIKELLFSTNNGMILYNPIYLLVIAGLVYMVAFRIRNGWAILGILAALVYIFSSWFIFSFGCGFGSRNFVEYATLFSLPLGYLYSTFERHNLKRTYKKAIIGLAGVMILFNLKLVYSYNKCFEAGDWNFKEFGYLLLNSNLSRVEHLNSKEQEITSGMEYSKGIKVKTSNVALVNFRRAVVQAKVMLDNPENEAQMVLSVTAGDSTIYWNGCRIAGLYDFEKLSEYQTVTCEFWLPAHYTRESEISAYLWNMNKDEFYLKRIRVYFY